MTEGYPVPKPNDRTLVPKTNNCTHPVNTIALWSAESIPPPECCYWRSSHYVQEILIINGIIDITLSSPVGGVLLNRQNTLPQPLGEEVAAPSTVCVSGSSQRFFQWLQKGLLKVFTELILLDGIINCSESWLLVIMEDSPVSMENENTLLLCR